MSSQPVNSFPVNIDVLVVVDTEYIKRLPHSLIMDPYRPNRVDHNGQYMIASGQRATHSGQGTADLNFTAFVGDTVRFRGTSVCQNSDDAVIIYDIQQNYGDRIFGEFTCTAAERHAAVMPNVDSPNGLPSVTGPLTVTSFNALVEKPGEENFFISFALYTMGNDGQTQYLFGYYNWDPVVVSQGPMNNKC